jgi:hypothetical protein
VQDRIRFRPQGLQGILPEAKMVFRVQQSAEPTEHADAALQLARTFREGQIQARLRPVLVADLQVPAPTRARAVLVFRL